MLAELFKHWLSPCPPQWKRLGYLREQIAIEARVRRCRKAWEGHLEATRGQILAGAQRCKRRRCALLLGAGLGYDLPLEELCAQFERVVLADLVHSPAHRRRAEAAGALCVEFDASGVLGEIVRRGPGLSEAELWALVRLAEPGLPAETLGEPDLLVSANLASQLMLLPAEWLERQGERSEKFGERLAAVAAQAHLRWLAARPCIHVLVTERARRRVARDGALLERSEILGTAAWGQVREVGRAAGRAGGAAVGITSSASEAGAEAGTEAGAVEGPEAGARGGRAAGRAECTEAHIAGGFLSPALPLLGEPSAQWLWRLAPIPEASRAYHLEHEVSSWIW